MEFQTEKAFKGMSGLSVAEFAKEIELNKIKNTMWEEKADKRDKAILETAQALIEQNILLQQQLNEAKEQNKLLKELYESAKKEAENNVEEAKKSRRFAWVSFIFGSLIGIAGVVVGIIY